MKYCCLGVFREQIENTHSKTPQRQYSGHNTHLGHKNDCGPIGLGQHNSLGESCGPHTASSVFLIFLL